MKLYRRHRKDCEARFPEDAKTGEFEEGRRGWKKCSCLIHASGTIGNRFSQQSTGCWRWEDAKAFLARVKVLSMMDIDSLHSALVRSLGSVFNSTGVTMATMLTGNLSTRFFAVRISRQRCQESAESASASITIKLFPLAASF